MIPLRLLALEASTFECYLKQSKQFKDWKDARFVGNHFTITFQRSIYANYVLNSSNLKAGQNIAHSSRTTDSIITVTVHKHPRYLGILDQKVHPASSYGVFSPLQSQSSGTD
jgi:hypothetical protein